jgi:hypothetical protein
MTAQAGALFITLSVVNMFYNGLPYTIFWGLCGLGILLLGYEQRAFGLGLLALVFVILAAAMMIRKFVIRNTPVYPWKWVCRWRHAHFFILVFHQYQLLHIVTLLLLFPSVISA